MPRLTTLPAAPVLEALGRLALHFGALEFWVNAGIIEAESISDPQQQSNLTWESFKKRVNRLTGAFQKLEANGLTLGPVFPSAADLIKLAEDRNHVLHGSPAVALVFDQPVPSTTPDKPVTGRAVHLSHNLRDRTYTTLKTETLDELSEKASEYALRLMFLVGDLASAKRARGEQSLTLF